MARRTIFLSLVAVLLVLGSISAYTAVRYAAGDMAALKVRTQIDRWQRDVRQKPQIGEIGQARNALIKAVERTPDDPALHESLAYLYGLRAAMAASLPALEHAMLDEVLTHYRSATTRRPMAPYAWVNIAQALHRKNEDPAAMWAALDRALAYGRREGGVQIRLAGILLARWDEAGVERQTELRNILLNSRGRAARQLRQMVVAAGRQDLLPQG
jgi:tetratricopeptide (TPR) repeat protein